MFYEAPLIVIPNQTKAVKQQQKKTLKIMTKPVSLMHIDGKILVKILVNRAKQYIRRIIYHDEVEFIPGIQSRSVF